MTGRFFITGLPRSRTAWLAVATTTPTSVCWHEPLCHIQSFTGLREFWAPKMGVDIGISDSGLATQLGRILEELKPRTIIVERPLEDALLSFQKFAAGKLHVDEKYCRRFAEIALAEIWKYSHHPLVKVVEFAALDDYDTMLDAMNWLLPGQEFPDLKALMTFNIQAKASEVERTSGLPHTNWHLQDVSRETL